MPFSNEGSATPSFRVTPGELTAAAGRVRGWAATVTSGLAGVRGAGLPDPGDGALAAALGAVVADVTADLHGWAEELERLASALGDAARRYAGADASGVPGTSHHVP